MMMPTLPDCCFLLPFSGNRTLSGVQTEKEHEFCWKKRLFVISLRTHGDDEWSIFSKRTELLRG